MTISEVPRPVREAARCLWNYHRLEQTVVPADGIVVFGSNDLRVASHAAEMFLNGMGPWVLFSGARGRMTEHWTETEAEAMARVVMDCGVPQEAILVEPMATNTGENIRFSQQLLAGRKTESLIAVQKPYMERRTLAALEVQWPGPRFQVTSPGMTFEDYFTEELTPQIVIEAMTGDFRRILDYPALGFASEQVVTEEAMAAYRVLVDAGFEGK